MVRVGSLNVVHVREILLLLQVVVLMIGSNYHLPVHGFSSSTSFSKTKGGRMTTMPSRGEVSSLIQLHARISKERRKELGIGDDEDEYDLDKALDVNTDPLITKIIAGSLIITLIALLVVGVIIPFTSEVEEGLCNPILNAGRC